MRRNLTISFDEGFIRTMDERRGAWSRGVYVEELFADQENLVGPSGPDKRPNPMPAKPPERVIAYRASPKLRSGIKPRPKGKKK